MARKYVVKIGTGDDGQYVVKVKSYAVADNGFKALSTTPDKDKARRFTLNMATAVAKRNAGHVVEVDNKPDA